MARRKSIESRNKLKALVRAWELRSIGLNTGFLKRSRKLDLFAFLWTLTFGASSSNRRTLAGLWRSYQGIAQRKVTRAAFFKWLSRPELADWMTEILDLVMNRLDEDGVPADERLSGVLGRFREIYATDASVLRLHDRLQALFPGSRTNSSPAAMKLHVVQQVGGSGLQSVSMTSGKTADLKAFKVGPWVQDALVLMDLGYYDYWLFNRIGQLGGYFISRVKTTGNPKILRGLRTHRGRKVEIDGEKLRSVLPKLKRQVLDVQVEVEFKTKRKVKGKYRKRRCEFRLVGVWNRSDRCYHLYYTNIPSEFMNAGDIANGYRLRWQIELLFRELKGVHQMDQLPTENPTLVQALILASLVASIATRRLLDAVRSRLHLIEAELPYEKGARIIREVAPWLLQVVTLPARLAKPLAEILESQILTVVEATKTRRRNLLRERQELTGHPELGSMMGSGSPGAFACAR